MIGTFFLYIEKIQYSCHVILENFDQQIYTTAKSFSTKIIFFKICITNYKKVFSPSCGCTEKWS